MEIWDIYDENREKTGKTMIRGHEIKKGDYHIVVHVCIINSKNEMLIQQRQPFKEGFPNKWDVTIGGSASTGEVSKKAAERELFEEIGYLHDFTNDRAKFTINFQHGFDDYYIINEEVDLSLLKLQQEEVQDVKWATKKEILQMIEDGVFVPYHKDLINLIFDIQNYKGSIVE